MPLRADGAGAWSVAGYEVEERLGEGGFGTVYAARDRSSGHRIALKELTRPSASALARFKQEFRALVDLHDEHLVGLKELFEHEGRWFIVMELVEGPDLLGWIDGARESRPDELASPRLREGRIRTAFSGVAQGLVTLHAHGMLHRDLKPSNVRVTREGRAVLLDFGLIATVGANAQSTQAGPLGTAAYMAPEQAAGERVSAAADWYAFGVCLYEALAGRLPFRAESPLQVMLAKQGARPEPPSAFGADVPEGLNALCMALLEPDPGARPSGPEVLDVLEGAGNSKGPRSIAPSLPPVAEMFTGRAAELAHLTHALDETQEGEPRVVLVEGESGVGKSALVREHLRLARAEHEDLLVLYGRCYESEQVPYKAFDGCIDELAKVMKRWTRAQCAAVLPRHAGLLPQLFPVLRDVTAFACASTRDASADPTARRIEAFSALAQLLARVAEERPVVVAIDDLQWADVESFRMLRALLDDRSRPAVLVLATVRPRSELDPAVAEQLAPLRERPSTQVLPLIGLPREHAHDLVKRMIGEHAPAAIRDVIARESKGHPLLLAELVQYAASHDVTTSATISLEAALAARIRALDAGARALLELVALSGRPYPIGVFADALGARVRVEDGARTLLSRKLVVSRRGEQLVCLHDRIRHTAVGLIASTRLPLLHRDLAEALSKLPSVDATETARHWDQAGEHARAAIAYEQAANVALESLAFARAEALYARALELVSGDRDAHYVCLVVARGHALARGGRSAEAAEAYLEGAAYSQDREKVRLRILAAQHLLQAADLGRGLTLAREVLEELGLPLPSSEGATLAKIAWQRVCLAVGRRDADVTPDVELPPEQRLVLDALHQLGFPVGWNDVLLAALINMHHQRRALASGDPGHLAFALAHEAGFLAMQRPGASSAYEPLLTRSRELVERHPNPLLEAEHAFTEGTIRNFSFDVVRARDKLAAAEKLIQTRCPGEPWLLTNVRMPLGHVLYIGGAHRELAELAEGWIAEAEERGDRFTRAAIAGLGCGFARHLMRDQPDAARREIEAAVAPWPSDPFTLAHFGELSAVVETELYRGGLGAHRWLTERTARHDRAFMMRMQYSKTWRDYYRATSAVAALSACPASERAQLRAEAKRRARDLTRNGSAAAGPFALLVEAQLDALDGQLARAAASAHAVAERFATLGMHAFQRAARYLAGCLEEGERGRAACDEVLAALRAEGWVDPFRGVTLHAPAVRMLEARERTRDVGRARLVAQRYEVLAPRGAGGFGTVVEARDVRSGRRVALKELVHESPAALARFKNEFRAVQGVHHPNLVRLDALLEDQGTWYIAMELVDGDDLMSWVRPSGTLDEARLRASFAGLVRGLAALHEAGFVHRDVTPENVRVTPEGRVVLLDFGLLAGRDDTETRDPDALIGTAEYMAPEQASGGEPDAAVDAYSVGVCLYRALFGLLPFEGHNAFELVQQKRTRDAVLPPRMTSVSDELARLCLRLLARDPAQRPALSEVLSVLEPQRLGHGLPSGMSLAPRVSFAPPQRGAPGRRGEAVFVGREAELAALERAYADSRAGTSSLVFVEGESGVGKSALVSELVERLVARDPELLVLRSRCYDNEDVPYEAFDAAIDDLARTLRRLPPDECTALLPPRAAVLMQLFPVLGTVGPVRRAPKKGVPIEPAAQRLQAMSGLRTLFAKLCARRPVLLVIDDLQWADAESFRLLRQLAEGEGAPPLMLLCTVRPLDEVDAALRAEHEHVRALQHARLLPLSPLDASSTERAAASLLGASVPEAWIEAVAVESRGHPLFLRELASYVAEGGDVGGTAGLELDEAISSRIRRLSPGARRLLELVAMAGRPHGLELYVRALGARSDADEALATLRAERLVRVRRGHTVVCEHNRIRPVVLRSIARERMAELCASLARALEAEPDSDPSDRARLWDAAGDEARAIVAYEAAVDRALELLAFQQAQRLSARLLKLLGDARDARFVRVMTKRGRALASDGRSTDAARAFELSAEHAQGDERARLRILAAQQLIQGAQVEAGMRTARAVLEELDLALPEGTVGLLSSIVWERARFNLRGVRIAPRADGELASTERLRLDALHELAAPMGWGSVLASAVVNARHLRLALAAGEPGHVARALCQEASFRALQHPERPDSYQSLFELARPLVQDSPSLEAFMGWLEGTAAMFASEPRRALSLLERAHELMQTRCPGEAWILTNVRSALASALHTTGEHREHARRMEEWIAEARERDDRFALAALVGLGFGCVRHLLRDDHQAAWAELDEMMRGWPDEPFALAHLGEYNGRLTCLGYQGGRAAYEWLVANEARLARAFVMKTRFSRMWHDVAYAQSALGALPEAASGERATLRAFIVRSERRLRASPIAVARSFADLIAAQLAHVEGRSDQAALAARAAHEAGVQADYAAIIGASLYLWGAAEGGDAGRARCEQALASYRDRGFVDPLRALSMHAPVARFIPFSGRARV